MEKVLMSKESNVKITPNAFIYESKINLQSTFHVI